MNYVLIALKLLPIVLQFVHMAESVFPHPNSGTSKQALVLDTLEKYLANVPALAEHTQQIKAAVMPMISTGVALLNMFGWGRAASAVQAASAAVDTIAAAVAQPAAAPADAPADAPRPASHWDKPVGSTDSSGA